MGQRGIKKKNGVKRGGKKKIKNSIERIEEREEVYKNKRKVLLLR